MNQQNSQQLKKGDENTIPSNWPSPKPEDIESPEAVVRALYDLISGGADETRDWQRFRSLCLPDARFLIMRWVTPDTEIESIWEWNVEGFVAEAQKFYSKNGFWEREIRSHSEKFGNVAHVFSTYESRINSPEEEPIVRGINSFQLVKYQGRWWIAHVCWDVERPNNQIPSKYDAK